MGILVRPYGVSLTHQWVFSFTYVFYWFITNDTLLFISILIEFSGHPCTVTYSMSQVSSSVTCFHLIISGASSPLMTVQCFISVKSDSSVYFHSFASEFFGSSTVLSPNHQWGFWFIHEFFGSFWVNEVFDSSINFLLQLWGFTYSWVTLQAHPRLFYICQ